MKKKKLKKLLKKEQSLNEDLYNDIKKLLNGNFLEIEEVKNKYRIKFLFDNVIFSGRSSSYLDKLFEPFSGFNGVWSFYEDTPFTRHDWKGCHPEYHDVTSDRSKTFFFLFHTPKSFKNDNSRVWTRPPHFVKYEDYSTQILMNETQRFIMEKDAMKPRRACNLTLSNKGTPPIWNM